MSWIQLSTELSAEEIIEHLPGVFDDGRWVDEIRYERVVDGVGVIACEKELFEGLCGFGLKTSFVHIAMSTNDPQENETQQYWQSVLVEVLSLPDTSAMASTLNFHSTVLWTPEAFYLDPTDRSFDAVTERSVNRRVIDIDFRDESTWPWLRSGREPGALLDEAEFAAIARRLTGEAGYGGTRALLTNYQSWEEFPDEMYRGTMAPASFDARTADRSIVEWYLHFAIAHGELVFVSELNRRLASLDDAYRDATEPDHDGLNHTEIEIPYQPVSREQPSHWWLRRHPKNSKLLTMMLERHRTLEDPAKQRLSPKVHPFEDDWLNKG